MTRDEIRYLAHQTLERIEWLNKHIAPRHLRDAKMVEDLMVDLERAMLKLIDTPLNPPTEAAEGDEEF